MRLAAALLALIVLPMSAPAGSATAQALLRSDLPLWTGRGDDENFYPRNFFDEDDGSFGCISNIWFGDYRVEYRKEEADEEAPDPTYVRITNYGVFHCALVIRTADTVEGLENAPFEFFWIIRLWEQGSGDESFEVLAFQQGAMGGSRYELFRRPTGQMDAPLTLLAARCPREMVRDNGGIDVWMTGYCAVPDRPGLRRIARDALRRAPVGRLVRIADEPNEE